MASLRISFYTIVKVRTWQIQKRVIVLHFNPYHCEGDDTDNDSASAAGFDFNPRHCEDDDLS